jgi:4-carboxymuconolactone decarboxylase
MTQPVRLSQPRVPTLPESEWTDEQRVLLGSDKNPMGPLNIFRTLIRHVELYRRFMKFGHQVLFRSSLTPREREIVILRVGWRCDSAYEFHQHTRIGKQAGLSGDEIERIKQGPDAAGWTAQESALLRAVDELCDDSFVSDATWNSLSLNYGTQQLIDLVFLVGHYSMIAMALNSLGVQIEAGEGGGAAK